MIRLDKLLIKAKKRGIHVADFTVLKNQRLADRVQSHAKGKVNVA